MIKFLACLHLIAHILPEATEISTPSKTSLYYIMTYFFDKFW